MSDSADVESEVLTALGGLVVNVSAMEESLHDAIWLISGAENRSVHVLSAGLAFRTLVEKFGALCVEMKTCRIPVEDVSQYCAHLNSLNDQRNTIIHSAWNWRGSAGTRRFKRTAKIKTGFSLNITNTTPNEIRELAERFRQAEQKLWEIVP